MKKTTTEKFYDKISLAEAIESFEVTHEWDMDPLFTSGKEPKHIVHLKITLIDGSYLYIKTDVFEFHDASKGKNDEGLRPGTKNHQNPDPPH